jgi:hypothetical protein
VSDRIQSWVSILAGTAVVLLVGWLTMEQMSKTRIRAEWDGGAVAAGGAGASSATAGAAPTGDAGSGTGTGTGTTGIGALDPSGDGGFSLGGLGTLFGDSGVVPTGAPRAVRLGVVLVAFTGAEGAPSSARAKPDALKHAAALGEQAKADWKAAVKAGDHGSAEDIGRIPRGVLDARTEVAVFSLGKDEISEPLETPKGYWIVKRIE